MKENATLFTGFTKETFQFFNDISENNYKEWFDANKSVYEEAVLNPLKNLGIALTVTMHNIDPKFDLRTHRIVSRIYRDTRFSKNKDPYKDRMWLYFEQPTDDCGSFPGFYIEFSANGYTIDMGMYKPKKIVMDSLRDKITYDALEFEKESKKLLDLGFEICGEEYKRPIKNNLPPYFQQWIQRKSIYVSLKKDIDKELFSTDLVDVLQKQINSLVWLYNFMKDE